MQLDINDLKILNQLDLNCRQSDAEIGKKTRISKQVVNYRIKRLQNEKIIISFFPHTNIAKLGYGIHKIYIQWRSLTKTKEQEIWNYLTNQERVIWGITCSGRFDLIFAIASKTIEEFDKSLTEFMNKYSKHIANREITVFNKASLYHRKWFLQQKQESVSWLLGGKIQEEAIDDLDRKILNILHKEARAPIIEIAQKTNTSSSLIIQRIRRLQQKGIIGSFRFEISREKLEISYCKSFVYYQNKTSEQEQQLLTYCSSLSSIVGVSQSIGSWDLELEFEVKSYPEFHNVMKEMKNQFPIIRNFETVYIEKEFGLSFLP